MNLTQKYLSDTGDKETKKCTQIKTKAKRKEQHQEATKI